MSVKLIVYLFLYWSLLFYTNIIKELKRNKIKKEGRVMQRCKGEGVGAANEDFRIGHGCTMVNEGGQSIYTHHIIPFSSLVTAPDGPLHNTYIIIQPHNGTSCLSNFSYFVSILSSLFLVIVD